MPDNPRKQGKADDRQVSKQTHELQYLKDKFHINGQAVAAAQREAGPSRPKVEELIKAKLKSGAFKRV